MDVVEWSSVSVLIFVGLATLSTGERSFTRDKLPALRRLTSSSSCHLRCVRDSNKASVEKECIRSCQGKLTRSIEQSKSHEFSKRMITGRRLFIRHQRSVNNMNVLDDCQFSKGGPRHKAKILLVNLTGERWLHIKWEAIDSSETDFNWTGYALIYRDNSITRAKCILVPKNQTDYLVKQVGDWKLPYFFHTAVVVNPYGQDKVDFQRFTIGGHPNTYQIPTVHSKVAILDTVTLISSIAGGLIAAVVLLVLYAVKCRRKPPSPGPPDSPEENTMERYYSCYYPESEEFRQRVASIVNCFRENGYNVIMDVMVSEEISSQGPTRWGENQIRKAKKVLIFLSPGLVNLAMGGREDSQCQDVSRVWIELEVLRDIYTKNRSAAKMVCITLPDVPVTDLPLWAKVSYNWPGDHWKILKRLNDRPMILPA